MNNKRPLLPSLKTGALPDVLWAVFISVIVIAALDLATNSLDTEKYAWDFVYYIAMARDGFDAQPLASPFAYRYLTPLLVNWISQATRLSIEEGFTVVAWVGALAQAAGILAIESLGLGGTGKLVYFMAIEEAKFRNPVEPGVLLNLEASFVQKRAKVCKFRGKASVDGKVTCEVQFTAMIADPPQG